MAKSLPEDIMHQILSRLPVKSLVRFTCVSKPWAALIYSSGFAKSHFKQSTITKSVVYVMFEHKSFSVNISQLSNGGSGGGADDTAVEEIKNYPSSHPPDMDYSDIVGCCNGLLYLVNKFSDDAVLFNPLTRNYRKIPNIITQVEGRQSRENLYDENVYQTIDDIFEHPVENAWFWGCVYDEVNDDYKVVGINVKQNILQKLCTGECEMSGWIYSSISGSWRRIADMPSYNMVGPKWGAYVFNALYWLLWELPPEDFLLDYIPPRYVVAFDMGTEKFRLLPLPDYPRNECTRFDLKVLDGCLCFCCLLNQVDYYSFEVWMMRECGAENRCNWDRLIKLRFYPEHCSSTVQMKALALSGRCELLLVYVEEKHDASTKHMLEWYDLEKEQERVDSTCQII